MEVDVVSQQQKKPAEINRAGRDLRRRHAPETARHSTWTRSNSLRGCDSNWSWSAWRQCTGLAEAVKKGPACTMASICRGRSSRY